MLKTLATYRLVDPGSEWRLHRHWYGHSALADLLGAPEALSDDVLYRCLDKLLAHRREFFGFLRERWETLFDARFDVLLYDLTSTYFESDPTCEGLRQFGYSRDKRPDCVQVVIGLAVTPQGFPLAYETMPGNTSEKSTLAEFLAAIESRYGRSERVWIMDRGIPTEETLEAMREGDAPVSYLVGTPKGRLTALERSFLALPWREVRDAVEVKLLAHDSEVYVLARSRARVLKERSMRRRRLRKLWRRLGELRELPARHAQEHGQSPCARPDSARGDREVRHPPDGGRPPAHIGRTRTRPAAPHAAGRRPPPAAPPARSSTARTTAAAHPRPIVRLDSPSPRRCL